MDKDGIDRVMSFMCHICYSMNDDSIVSHVMATYSGLQLLYRGRQVVDGCLKKCH